MMEQLGKALRFRGWFQDAAGAGLTGISVTVNVRKPDGTLVSPSNQVAPEIGDGWYGYTVVGGSVDAAGPWVATFKTVNAAANGLQWPDIREVGAAWVEHLDADLSAVQEAIGDGGDLDGYTRDEQRRIVLAALGSKVAVNPEGTSFVARAADDSKARITAVTTRNGNRTAVTLDGTP